MGYAMDRVEDASGAAPLRFSRMRIFLGMAENPHPEAITGSMVYV